MSRARLADSLRIVVAALAVLGLCLAGFLAYRRPEHVLHWLTLLQLCGR